MTEIVVGNAYGHWPRPYPTFDTIRHIFPFSFCLEWVTSWKSPSVLGQWEPPVYTYCTYRARAQLVQGKSNCGVCWRYFSRRYSGTLLVWYHLATLDFWKNDSTIKSIDSAILLDSDRHWQTVKVKVESVWWNTSFVLFIGPTVGSWDAFY